MATASGNFYGEYSKQSRLRLYWEYTQDIANNCDYFYLALYAQKTSGTGTHTNNYHNSKYFITGFSEDKLINETGDFSWGNTTEMFIGESSFTHYHDNAGNSGDVYVGGNWFTNLTSSSVVGTNLYVEGYVTGIPQIPRKVNITSFSVSKRDETSVKFNWSADANCDWAWYCTDTIPWTSLPSSNIVSGLAPNTTYNFKLRLRRTDSQLTTDSGIYAQTTYDYPKPTSINDFIIGEGAKIVLYNPLNRKCKIEIISREDGSNLGTYEGNHGSGTYNAEFKTESAIDAQYKSIPNSQSGKYYAKVTYGNSVKTKGDKIYSVKADECYPEFQNFEYEDISVNALNLTENNQLLINNYSECQFKIGIANKATAKKYASIAYYYCTWGNKSVNIYEDLEQDVIGSILGGTGGTLKVVAVDSRGLRSQIDTTINVPFIPYTAPIISNLETQRKDGVDIETYIAFRINMFNGNWDNENKENTLVAVKYRAKFGDEEYGEWGDITDTVLALTPYVNGDVKTYTLSLYNKTLIHANGSNGGFETGKAYTVQLMVQDGYDTYYLETIYSTTDVIDGKIGMSRYKDSNGDYHYGINRMPDPNCNFVSDKASFGTPYDPKEGGPLQVDGSKVVGQNVMTINAQRYWQELNNTWTFYPITNMSVYSSTGTKLSFTDNAIKIGKGVSKVLVSGTGDWNHGHTCDRCLQIYKNSDIEVASNYHGQETTNYVSSSISPKVLDVKENDVIKIGVLTQTPSSTEILEAFLTVEVIE